MWVQCLAHIKCLIKVINNKKQPYNDDNEGRGGGGLGGGEEEDDLDPTHSPSPYL